MQHLRNNVAPFAVAVYTRLRGKKPHPRPPQLVSPDPASPRIWRDLAATHRAQGRAAGELVRRYQHDDRLATRLLALVQAHFGIVHEADRRAHGQGRP